MAPFQFISRLIDDEDPVIIMPFGGYASSTHIFAQARVLEDEGIEDEVDQGFIKNLYHSFKRFETDEKENASVRISSGEFSADVQSDEEGYVYVDHKHGLDFAQQPTTSWISLKYELIENNKVTYSISDELMLPSSKASYGIITDMDDTVIRTGLSSTFKWRVIRNSFFRHSSKRLPLEGALELYNALQKGPKGKSDNPFFYLSNSPWNLHEYLIEFLRFKKFPKGVLLLRDIGFENEKNEDLLEGNKYVKISHILNTYTDLKFVLIGDAADLDHEIYVTAARNFPDRIEAIYIRAVEDKPKMEKVAKFVEDTTDVEVILIEHTDEAVAHARANGLII